jgi:uroporphyrinogen decarboxylase
MPVRIEPLSREEVIKAVERKRPSRIPLVNAKWWGEGLVEQYGERLREFDGYPEDVVWYWINNPVDPGRMNLSWTWGSHKSHDTSCVIDDWAKLDEFIEKLPRPESDPQLEGLAEAADKARAQGRYFLFAFWNLFFEKPWGLRGMQNLFTDYYSYPDEINRLHKAMSDTYCAYIRAAARIGKPDGLWTSDDLGHQTGPMMSPQIFHELIFPYYQIVGKALKECNMHFWLHSCGNNTDLLPDLVESGLTVFHPVQKHTMCEKTVAEKFGDKLTFLAGIDVQHTLQEKDPDGVREEVRFLIDTFDRGEGGLCIAAGNGIVRGTPFENIRAFLDETVIYGGKHRRLWGAS